MSAEPVSSAALTLLGKPGCHLCDEMAAVTRPVAKEYGLRLVERDVRDDPETERLYLLDIPVLLLGEAEIARHRVRAEDLRSRLESHGLRAR